MNRKLMSVMIVVAMMLAGGLQAVQAETWDAYTGFSTSSNTSSDQWQYLSAVPGDNSDYQHLLLNGSSTGWEKKANGATDSSVVKNTASGYVEMLPGEDSPKAAVIGWKNLSSSTKTVNVSFSLLDLDNAGYEGSDGVAYWLMESVAGSLKEGTIVNGDHLDTFTATDVSVASGDMLYLQIGPRVHNWSDLTRITFSVTSVPEPSTLILLAAGLVGLLAYAWRKRK